MTVKVRVVVTDVRSEGKLIRLFAKRGDVPDVEVRPGVVNLDPSNIRNVAKKIQKQVSKAVAGQTVRDLVILLQKSEYEKMGRPGIGDAYLVTLDGIEKI
jgi:hypothetical protein